MTPDQKAELVDNAMDLAANADKFRFVMILTIANDGTASVVRRRSPGTTNFEVLGLLDWLINDTRAGMGEGWTDADRPMKEA